MQANGRAFVRAVFQPAVGPGNFQPGAEHGRRIGPGAFDVGDGPAAMFEDGQAVVDGGVGVSLADIFGKNALHLAAKPAGVIKIVQHQIEHHAAGFLKIGEPVVHRLFGAKTAARQADDRRLADFPGGDQRPGPGVLREKSNHVGHQQLHPGGAAGGNHFLGGGNGAGQRLLADDIFAGGGGLQHLRVMQVGGSADVHYIHLGQQGFVGGENFGVILPGYRPGGFGRVAEKSGDGGRGFGPAGGVGSTHEAGANNSNSHR